MLTPKNADVIRIGPHRGYVPKSWNDLPTKQLIEVYAALVASGYEVLKPTEVIPYQRLVVLAILLNTNPADLLSLLGLAGGEEQLRGEARLEVVDTLEQLLDQIDFCFEKLPQKEDEEGKKYRLYPGLTRNPYRELKGPDGKLYGPANGLNNVSVYELGSILTLMSVYDQSGEPADLRRVLATIYRPAKINYKPYRANPIADPRQRLYKTEHLIDRRARQWLRVPPIVQSLLYFWLQCCRHQIVTAEELSVLFDGKGGQEDPDGWAGTLLHLAGNSAINMEQVSNTRWPEALRQLAREARMAAPR